MVYKINRPCERMVLEWLNSVQERFIELSDPVIEWFMGMRDSLVGWFINWFYSSVDLDIG